MNSLLDDDAALIREKLIDALTPGSRIEFDPNEAQHVGAFVEDALSEVDASESETLAGESACD